MARWMALVPLFALAAAAQDRSRTLPVFPPDMIVHDSPVRDLAKLDTKHAKVDFENERTRVLRITLAAGESTIMHDSRDGTLVCPAACAVTVTNPAGYTLEIKLAAGGTQWMPAARHRITAGAAAVEILYIEVKRPDR